MKLKNKQTGEVIKAVIGSSYGDGIDVRNAESGLMVLSN